MENVEQKIIGIIREVMRLRDEEITRATRFVEDLGIDEIDFLDVTMAIEDAFELTIPESEWDDHKTVGSLVDFVESKLPK